MFTWQLSAESPTASKNCSDSTGKWVSVDIKRCRTRTQHTPANRSNLTNVGVQVDGVGAYLFGRNWTSTLSLPLSPLLSLHPEQLIRPQILLPGSTCATLLYCELTVHGPGRVEPTARTERHLQSCHSVTGCGFWTSIYMSSAGGLDACTHLVFSFLHTKHPVLMNHTTHGNKLPEEHLLTVYYWLGLALTLCQYSSAYLSVWLLSCKTFPNPTVSNVFSKKCIVTRYKLYCFIISSLILTSFYLFVSSFSILL